MTIRGFPKVLVSGKSPKASCDASNFPSNGAEILLSSIRNSSVGRQLGNLCPVKQYQKHIGTCLFEQWYIKCKNEILFFWKIRHLCLAVGPAKLLPIVPFVSTNVAQILGVGLEPVQTVGEGQRHRAEVTDLSTADKRLQHYLPHTLTATKIDNELCNFSLRVFLDELQPQTIFINCHFHNTLLISLSLQ